MKATKIFAILALTVALMICWINIVKAAQMTVAFTYQGRLMDANGPADGLYDFQFKLWMDPCEIEYPPQVGDTITMNDLDVIDGYFTVELDFNSPFAFNGEARWLEISVRPADSNDVNDYVTLTPRQEITPTPYALQTRGIFVDNLENIGMGTTNPKGKLHVDGGKAADDTDASDITIKAQDGGDAVRGFVGRRGGDIILLPGEGGESTDLKPPGPSGKVGIGTSGPEAMLDVRGNIKVDQKIQAFDSGGLELATDEGTTRIFVGDDGNVGIGTAAPRASLEVTNTGNSHAIWASTSDIPVYAHRIATAGTWPAVAGDCNSQAGSASGVRGRILSTSPGSLGAGVYGYNYGIGGNGVGVRGHHAGSGTGVYGQCDNGKGVYGISSSSYGVYGVSSSSYGVYGISNSYGVRGYNGSSGNYGYLGGSDHGVYGESGSDFAVRGYNSGSGNYGNLGGSNFGVWGYSSGDGHGVRGASLGNGHGVWGESVGGYAGYFTGNVYVTDNVSAFSFTDRVVAYPKDLATAYQAVMSMERLPEGKYDEMSKETQLDHSKLTDIIKSKDGNRDLSATVSCHNEVLKDLIRKKQELIITNVYIEQLQERINTLEEKLVKLEAVLNPLK